MMDIQGKVAIVTGAGNGMGFEFVVELLNKGAKGVTLVDISEELGEKAVQKLKKNFDPRRILFVQADISNYKEFEDAFEKTLSTFNNIDILINNAGILDETQWQRMVQINLMGTVNGILLALEKYIPKYKSGEEGVVMNVSSIAGVIYHGGAPIYCGTKFAIHGMTLSWGVQAHYERTKVRVVALAPGGTKTALFDNAENKVLAPIYKNILISEAPPVPFQERNIVGTYGIKVIEAAPNGTFWIVEAGEPPYRYDMPDRFQIQKITLE